jgi:uncharacterized protein (DUF1778 family)
MWLTDFVLSETISAADDRKADSLPEKATEGDEAEASRVSSDDDPNETETVRAVATTPITPEIKAEIAEEIKQELARDNAAAAKSEETNDDVLPAALSTANHIFVVSTAIDVTTSDQEGCALQAGDILRLAGPAADGSTAVQLRVESSKRTDCPSGVLVSVSLQDLQDMQNNFQAEVESGLGTLQASQGHNGLPAAPAESIAAPPRPSLFDMPVSKDNLAALLDQQAHDANRAELEVAESAF